MDDIVLIASDTDTLGKIFNIVQKILPCWGFQMSPEQTNKNNGDII